MAKTEKERKTLKVIEYIGDPENDFPSRTEIALDILGYADKSGYYALFSTTEMSKIEEDGLDLRKQNSKRERTIVYSALLKEAKKGNVAACKEYLDRIEGKVVDRKDINLSPGKDEEGNKHKWSVEVTHITKGI